jgi:insertion element IS1 protein InsB
LLPVVSLPLHGDAAAGQAGGPETSGADALRDGQHEFLWHRTHPAGQRCGGSEVGARRRRSAAGAGDAVRHRSRDDRRDASFSKKKSDKLWLWRAYDPVQRKTLPWVLGDRSDATCKKLLAKIGLKGKIFVTDDWEGFHRSIPEDQLFTGKDLTFPIEQDNSNIRHYLARFRRRTKVVSKSLKMVDLTLRLHHHLRDPNNFNAQVAKYITIFS